MDENLLKLLELVEKDKVLFQLLRQCPYEILRNFKGRKYKDSRFVLKQGEIYNTFYINAKIQISVYFSEETIQFCYFIQTSNHHRYIIKISDRPLTLSLQHNANKNYLQ